MADPADPQQTGVPDGWSVVDTAAPPAKPAGKDFKVLGVNIHVPAPEAPRKDANMIGWGSEGAGIAPEDALIGAQAARKVVSAAPGMVSRVGAAAAQAAPLVKYQATKTILEHVGVPSAPATVIAGLISGYRKGPTSVGGMVSEAQAASAAPKLALSATDVVRLKGLISQGVPQVDALKILAAAKAGVNEIPSISGLKAIR